MENKEQKIWLTVTLITVITLVLIFAGITYAFFTTSDNVGSTAEIISNSGKMIITYEDGTNDLIISNNISPNSNKIIIDKTFSLTGMNTTEGLNMPFSINLEYQNTFKNKELFLFINCINDNSNVVVEYIDPNKYGKITQEFIDNNKITNEVLGYYLNYINDSSGNSFRQEIATGYFKPKSENEIATFNLKLLFYDNGQNQDYNKGAIFNGKIVISNKQSASQYLAEKYYKQSKDANGITIDGLQKDGTGNINSALLNNAKNKYNISFLDNTNNILADSEYDSYDNLRYVGENPNNYISFNNEIWRIIGVFKNITVIDENKIETKENLIKIIRNKSLGSYSWDTSASSINSGNGINEWSQADLMTELNDDYLKESTTREETTWYNGANNQKNGTYYYSNNIISNYVNKIATTRWNLGGINEYELTSKSSKVYYELERGTNHINNPGDNVTRSNYWDGKIALLYPSDYGYASLNETCRNNILSSECFNKNWLYSKSTEWILTPDAYYVITAYHIGGSGNLYGYTVSGARGVRPVLYLNSQVEITGGTGTSSDPYIID